MKKKKPELVKGLQKDTLVLGEFFVFFLFRLPREKRDWSFLRQAPHAEISYGYKEIIKRKSKLESCAL